MKISKEKLNTAYASCLRGPKPYNITSFFINNGVDVDYREKDHRINAAGQMGGVFDPAFVGCFKTIKLIFKQKITQDIFDVAFQAACSGGRYRLIKYLMKNKFFKTMSSDIYVLSVANAFEFRNYKLGKFLHSLREEDGLDHDIYDELWHRHSTTGGKYFFIYVWGKEEYKVSVLGIED